MGDGETERTLTRPMGAPSVPTGRRRARLLVVHPPRLRRTLRLLDEDVAIGRKPQPGLVLEDATVSRRHVVIRFADQGFSVEELGSRNGTRVNGAPLKAGTLVPLADGDLLRLGDVLLVFEAGLHRVPAPVDPQRGPQIVGEASPTVALRRALTLAAEDPAPALLVGETGTGKEFAARELHRLSGRSGAFVAVNCAALSPQLIEGQLFGHRRGAFTGADDDSPGLFRSAHGGTLLLDEIGELPDALQAKLLRVVQEGEVLPVGASAAVAVDVRIVAATLRPLQRWVDEGRFRLDLYARLSTFEIVLPPLRERRADIPSWLETLHEAWYRERDREPPTIAWDVDGLESILLHPLPDNLRGLGRIVHRGGALGDLPYRAEPLPAPAPTPPPTEATPKPTGRRKRPSRDELLRVLREGGGSVRALARHYACDRRQAYRWLDHYDLRGEIGRGD